MSEPQWEYFPDEPEKFFDLPPDYSKKDLKRKYNQLIRQYKPEKAPKEFQKIRSAYEELLDQLEYRDCQEDSFVFSEDQDCLLSPSDFPMEDEWERPDEPWMPENFRTAVREEDPQALWERLKNRSNKEAHHYYWLAFLSEIYEPQRKFSFLHWILEGIKSENSPSEDSPFTDLLDHYWQSSSFSPTEIERLLEIVWKEGGEEIFFSHTHSLWLVLIETCSFSHFNQILCTYDHLSEKISLDQIYFYFQIIPKVFWKADIHWLKEKIQLINHHHEEVPPFLEQDLVFWEILLEARENQSFLDQGAQLNRTLTRVVRDYCEKKKEEAFLTFLEFQMEMIQNPKEVLPSFSRSSPLALLPPYQWIYEEMKDWQGEENQQDVQISAENILSFSRKLEGEMDGSLWGDFWNIWLFAYFMALLFLIILPVPLINSLFPDVNSSGMVFDLIIWNVFVRAYLKERTIQKWSDQVIFWFASLCYSRFWRKKILAFMQDTGIGPGQLAEALSDIHDEELFYHDWIALFLQEDEGLLLYHQALFFWP